VDLSRFPDFDAGYFLFADAPSSALAHFGDEVRRRLLTGKARYQISAGGRFFIIARVDISFQQNRNKMKLQQWREHVDDMMEVFHAVASPKEKVSAGW
jgi:hypothetical protein